MPYWLTRFMCTVLKQMHYSIRLPHGQSTTNDSSQLPLYDTGQGAGWSPPCWAANSDIISCCMGKYTPGLLVTHPNNKIKSRRHLGVFVDDTSLGITQDVLRELQNTLESPVAIPLNAYATIIYFNKEDPTDPPNLIPKIRKVTKNN